jgi:hypothetical protein
METAEAGVQGWGGARNIRGQPMNQTWFIFSLFSLFVAGIKLRGSPGLVSVLPLFYNPSPGSAREAYNNPTVALKISFLSPPLQMYTTVLSSDTSSKTLPSLSRFLPVLSHLERLSLEGWEGKDQNSSLMITGTESIRALLPLPAR